MTKAFDNIEMDETAYTFETAMPAAQVASGAQATSETPGPLGQ